MSTAIEIQHRQAAEEIRLARLRDLVARHYDEYMTRLVRLYFGRFLCLQPITGDMAQMLDDIERAGETLL